MKILKLTILLLFCAMQYTAHAQDIKSYDKIIKAADSLAKANQLSESAAIYQKGLKIFNQDPILPGKLASVYLKMGKIEDANRFMKLAIDNGADLSMLLADTSINNYLKMHSEKDAVYSTLSKQHKLLMQINDKNNWIDEHRKEFNETRFYH
jgi:predicted Zn-dependent protease